MMGVIIRASWPVKPRGNPGFWPGQEAKKTAGSGSQECEEPAELIQLDHYRHRDPFQPFCWACWWRAWWGPLAAWMPPCLLCGAKC